MIWFLYSILFFTGYLLMLPGFLMRMKRRGGYGEGFMQRFGIYDAETRKALSGGDRRIWVHAVSVGEVHVASLFIQRLKLIYPEALFILTTNTPTGRAVAQSRLSSDAVILYFPTDFPVVIRRVMKIINPSMLLLTECELWPNLIRIASEKGVSVSVINGRISDSSYRGYMKLRWITGRVLPMVKHFLVQTQQEQDRLIELGANESSINVMGSAKYDVINVSAKGVEKAQSIIDGMAAAENSICLLGGSTWPGEEEVLLSIFISLHRTFPELKLVLVPRHVERRAEIEALLLKHSVRYLFRSDISDSESSVTADVLVVDTTGELMDYYACADVVFVGKSLLHQGGQNIIEPAMLGKAILTGPHLENFPVVERDFKKGGAIWQVSSSNALEDAVRDLLKKPELRDEYGKRALSVVEECRGVVDKSIEILVGR